MEDINALYKALEQADAAGDKESAQELANYIRTLPTEEPIAEEPVVDDTQSPPVKPPVVKPAVQAPIDVMGQQFTPEDYAKYSGMPIAAKPGEQAKGAFSGSFGRSIYNLAADLAIANGKVTGDYKAAEETAKRLREYGNNTYTSTTKGWKEDPLAKIQELAGGSAPYMIAPITAALGSTALGVTGIAAVAAPMIASTVQFTGSNLQRQMDQNKKLEDTSLLKAGGLAIPQAALDQLGFRFIPGVQKLFGKAGIELTEEAASTLVKKSILSKAGEKALATGKGMGVEGGTEAAQQLLERLQAGLSITNAEARKEYFDSFVGGAILSGGIGVSGQVIEGIASKLPEQKQAEVEKEIIEEPPTEEKRASRDTLVKETLKDLEEKANKINQAKADEAAQLKAAQQQQVVIEAADLESMSPANPMELTENTLTSWGLSKNSKAFKTLIGQDAGTPEGRTLIDTALEAHTGKINEPAVDTYKSLLDQQKVEADNGTRIDAGQGIDTGTIGINNEVPGQPKYGTPGTVAGYNEPTVNISGTPTTLPKRGEADVNAPLETIAPVVEEAPVVEKAPVEEVAPVSTQPKLASQLRALDSTNPLIEALQFDQASEEEVAVAQNTIKELQASRKAKRADLTKVSEEEKDIPLEAREPSDIRNDVLNLRNKVPEGVHPEIWDKYLKQKKWEAAEPYTSQEKTEMTKSFKRFGNAVKTYAPGQDVVAVAQKLNQEFNKLQPQEARGVIQNTGETPESIEGAFQKQYGKNVGLAKRRGLLQFLNDVSELPPDIGQVSPTTKAVYHKGVGYFITNRITKADAPRMLLHEIGVHYGLEGMLGTNNYKRIVKQIKQRHLTDKELKAAWDNTVQTYPEYAEGSDNFMQEVIANIGETAPNNTIWRQIVGYIKQFLSKLGYGWDINKITADDIRDMVQHSVRMSLAGKIKPTTTGVALTSTEETGAPKPTYYSPLARTITNAVFPKNITFQSAENWIDWFKNREGVKKDELEFSGIIDYLKMRGKDKVDKQELINYLADNGPQVEEIKLGVDSEKSFADDEAKADWVEDNLLDWIDSEYGNDYESTLQQTASEQAVDNYDFPYYVKEENVTDADGNKGYRVYMEQYTSGPIDDTYYFSEDEAQQIADEENNNGIQSYADDIYRELRRDFDRAAENRQEELEAEFDDFTGPAATKYGHVTLEGGKQNYVEIILKLKNPIERRKLKDISVVEGRDGWSIIDKDTGILFDQDENGNPIVYNSEAAAYDQAIKLKDGSYRVPKDQPVKFTHFHWEGVDNPIAHYRANQRMDITGARVLFVDEIQADWAQVPKTLRKRYIRQEAKKYGIKPEDMAKTVPGDWGFKKQLSDAQQKELNELELRTASYYSRAKDILKEEKKYYQLAAAEEDRLVKIVKQAANSQLQSSGVAIVVDYLTRPSVYRNAVRNGQVSDLIQDVVNLFIDNAAVTEIVADYRKYRQLESEFGHKHFDAMNLYNDALDKKTALLGDQEGKIERGPWVQDTEAWSNLILKNIVRFAVDQGYEKVAFVNGKQAAYKGGRLEEFEEIFATRNNDDTYNIHAILKDEGGRTREIPNVRDEELEEYVGSIADNIRDLQPGETDGWDADKIKIASQGMTEYYDTYVPRYMSKLLKKLGGGTLETISFEAPNAYAPPEQRIGDQVGFTITKEMAIKALKGQPLFARMSEEELDRQLAAAGNKRAQKVQPPSFKDNLMAHPLQTVGDMVRNFRKAAFSFDHAINQKIMAAMRKAGVSVEEIARSFYQMQISQAVKSDQIADLFMIHGDIRYDTNTFKFVVSDVKDSMSSIRDKLTALAKKYGVSEAKMYEYASAAFIARRSQGLNAANIALKKRVLKLMIAGKTSQARTQMDRNYKLVHLTAAEIKAGEKFFTDFKDSNGKSELEKLFKSWNKNRARVLNVATNEGLYSEEDAEALLDVMDYVPFFRDAQIEAGKGPKEYARGLLDAAADKRLKGSYQPVNNVFDNMERWTRYTIRKAVNNRAAQEKIRLYSQWIPDDIKILRGKERPKSGNTVNVWQNGKLVKYEFEGTDGKSMVDGFTGLEPVMNPLFNGSLRPAANFLRLNIVLQPVFSIAQIPMDIYNSMFTSQVRFPLAVPLQAIKEIMLTPFGMSAARNYLKTTGTVGKHDFSSEYDRIDIDAMHEAKKAGSLTKLLKIITHPLGVLAMASDNVIRQAVYSQVMLETKDQARAVHMAEEIINFRRTGSSGIVNIVRQNAPFVNANLQSLHIAFSTLLDSGIGPDTHGKAFKRLVTTGSQMFILAMIYAVLNADDDDYKKADPSEKDRYLFIPGSNGFKLPLRNDIITLLFKTLPEHLVNRFIMESEDSTKMLHALKVGLTRALTLPSGIPTIISPLIEANYNIDSNTGRPIIGRGQENLEEDLQYSNKYTTQLSRMMGDASGTSPAMIQHFFNRYFGTTSLLFGMVTNGLIASMRGEILPEKTVRDYLLQIPSMGSFVAKEHGARNINDYYELNDIVTKIVKSANRYKNIDYPKYQEYIAKDNRAEIINMKKEMAAISKELQVLRDYENKIYASKDANRWTPATKKAELDRLEGIRQNMLGSQLQLKERSDRYIQQLRYRGGL